MIRVFKVIVVLFCTFLFAGAQTGSDYNQQILKTYEHKLVELQKEYQLPSISVAIVFGHKVIYAKGFGYADIEQKIAATDSTPYRIASITKPIASTIILKLVQSGKLQLDENLKNCWPDYIDHFNMLKHMIRDKAPQYMCLIENYHYQHDDITLKQQLSHTSEGIPGENFKYSGFLYSQLSNMVDKVSIKDFYTSVKENIIIKLQMDRSLPQQSDTWRPEVIEALAKPYFKNDENKLVPGKYPKPDLGAGAGIIATVSDLAKFDIALDSGILLSSEIKELAFTPVTLNNGNKAPYGLGWFIGTYKNQKIVYHTGWQPQSFSGLYMKVIDKNFSMILLANSEDLIAPFMEGLEKGQIDSSPFAKAFLDLILK